MVVLLWEIIEERIKGMEERIVYTKWFCVISTWKWKGQQKIVKDGELQTEDECHKPATRKTADRRRICNNLELIIFSRDKRLFQCGSQEPGLVKYDIYTCKKWAVGLGYNKNTQYKIHNKQFAIWKIKCTIKYKSHTVPYWPWCHNALLRPVC